MAVVRTRTDLVEEIRLPEQGAFVIVDARGRELFRVTGSAPVVRVEGAALAAGEHPDLATHDALGLFTDTELATHEGAADPHAGYVREADASWVELTDAGESTLHSHPGGAGAPTDADYLVGTAHAGLSAEIVVGTAPGGELGGTWASPTVDATHSGSTHAATQTAAEATAGAALSAHLDDTADAHDASAISILDSADDFTATDVEGALAELQADAEAHVGAADPHTGYLTEAAHTEAAHTAMTGLATQAELDGHGHGQLHDRQHSITAAADHTFPGGSTFLRADGAFASPPGGSEAFPVGAVFIAVVATNPATLLGYGAWSAFAAGRVLVGLDAGQTEFDTVEETGGAKTHTLQASEMPAHTHVVTSQTATSGSATSYEHGTLDTSSTEAEATEVTGSTGGGGAHNNLQPYIVVYMWRRDS